MRYEVTGNGRQAPYGDGEHISYHRTLNAACIAAQHWHNPAVVRDARGNRYNVYTQEQEG